MGKLGRDIYRRKLERLLSQSEDEKMIALVSAVVAVQSGNVSALAAVHDLPREAVGAELGSPYHIPLWSLETLVNELLATPKRKAPVSGRTRFLKADIFRTLQVLHACLVKLENAEDGIFLEEHDVFFEMGRIAQRQFPWQRGLANTPNLYRSMLLYGTGKAASYFERQSGMKPEDFVKAGFYFSAALGRNEYVSRFVDLASAGISPELREKALSKLSIGHVDARRAKAKVRHDNRHTAYSPSVLRDFPIIAFGSKIDRLRAPIPQLIMQRYTAGLYLDIVGGGGAVWTEIGKRFETYVLEYLSIMMEPLNVVGEVDYGPKKSRHRTPDILVSEDNRLVAVIECKAKRMSFDARFADKPMVEAAMAFDELAKGLFQIWRFFSHARRKFYTGHELSTDCQGIVITADSWLAMARNQADSVVAAAHALADKEGQIEAEDRREVAFCQIDDVEYVLQRGSAHSFLAATRDIASGEKKGFLLSVAHAAELGSEREYPFKDRLHNLLPWMSDFREV